jgi:hypothetical protein
MIDSFSKGLVFSDFDFLHSKVMIAGQDSASKLGENVANRRKTIDCTQPIIPVHGPKFTIPEPIEKCIHSPIIPIL